ncbi:MAG: hypothetical protein R3F20_08790 [Planctomycetota bacterium]
MSSAASLKKTVEDLEKRFGGLRVLDEQDPLDQIVLLVLARGTNEKKARQALKTLRGDFVDWNEIRVSERFEIDRSLAVLGKRAIEGKALAIREVLAAVYGRFNRTSLVFLHEKNDRANARAREKLLKFLTELSPAIAAMMESYFTRKPVAIRAPMPKILVDEKLFPKGATVATVKKQVDKGLDAEEQSLFVWGVLNLHEEVERARQDERDRKEREKEEARRRVEDEKRRREEEAERKKKERELAKIRAAEERVAKKKAAEKAKLAKKREDERKKAAAAKKTAAKKAATKKPAAAAKKAATKKAAAKPAAKKAATRKPAAAKAAAKKPAAKKAAAKKAPAKKAAKKPAAKKATKKPAAKKATKKPAAKKTTKKTGGRKTGR